MGKKDDISSLKKHAKTPTFSEGGLHPFTLSKKGCQARAEGTRGSQQNALQVLFLVDSAA